MVNSKYKLVTPDEKRGCWWTREDYLNLIKICKTRSDKLFKKLVEDYEHLESEKFDESLIYRKRGVNEKERFIQK